MFALKFIYINFVSDFKRQTEWPKFCPHQPQMALQSVVVVVVVALALAVAAAAVVECVCLYEECSKGAR